MKSLLSNLAWVAFTLLLSTLVLEGVCRLLYSRKLDYQIEMSRYAATLKRSSAHGSIGHEHRPSRRARLMGVDVAINSHGFRDAEYPLEKPDGEYRIMLLGDSLTLGWGAAVEDLFAAGLQERFSRDFAACGSPLSVRVINTGVGNYNTEQEVSFFELRGRAFDPDLVLLNYFINDAEPTPRQKLPFALRYSYLGMSLWGRLDLFGRLYLSGEDFSSYYPRLYGYDREGWRRAQEAFGRLAGSAREHGFTLAMVLLPELHAIGPAYGFQAVHDQVREAALAQGIETVVELAPAFRGERPESLWVAMDDAHPNARAHAMIADEIHRRLTRRGIPGCAGA